MISRLLYYLERFTLRLTDGRQLFILLLKLKRCLSDKFFQRIRTYLINDVLLHIYRFLEISTYRVFGFCLHYTYLR